MDPIFLFSSSGHPPDASLNDAGPSSTQSQTFSASELLARSRTLDTFSSGSHAIDDIFNEPHSVANRHGKGGLPRGAVLDLSGPPGSGKSRIGLSWVVGARLKSGDGLGKGKGKGKADDNGESHESHGPEVDDTLEALIVDTEGALSPHLIYSFARDRCGGSDALANSICQGIHHVRITTPGAFMAFIHTLPEWLQRHDKVKLILVDSLSTHLRRTSSHMSDSANRSHITNLVQLTLSVIAGSGDRSAILTTQTSTKLFTRDGRSATFETGDTSMMVPALGTSWHPPKTYQIVLSYHDSSSSARKATLTITPSSGHAPPRSQFSQQSSQLSQWTQAAANQHGIRSSIFDMLG